ncbi:hypothetical protein Tsubulata_012544 [Turnera subulata]|uniref:PRA1 family protein n=1 Tax=Turnera subulata TaxID=218843 RepID=A0A9Q0GBY8_9ROSI|nr:hypothetical protein Tsubulata_012544 [Turnera subulata]
MSSGGNTTTEFLSAVKQTVQTLTTTLRPWSSFLDLTALSLPPSVPDATTRLTQNLTHFLANYSLLFSLFLLFPLIPHPLSLLAILALLLAWLSLYFSRDGPLSLSGFLVPDVAVLVALLAATVVVLAWSGVWARLLFAAAVGAAVLGLHAVLRSTDDLVADDLEASPYRDLLSDDEEKGPGAAL